MFNSVLGRDGEAKNKFGTGIAISVGVHAGLIAVVVSLTTRLPPIKEDFSPDFSFVAFREPAAAPPPASGGNQRAAVSKRQAATRKSFKQAAIIQPVEEVPDQRVAEPEGVLGGDENRQPGGVLGSAGEVVGAPASGEAEVVMAFGSEMTRPVYDQLALVNRLYSLEAVEAQVQGSMIVKCVIAADGSVRNCRVIKGLPFLSESLVHRIQSMKMEPARFMGKPVSVDYQFNFQFSLPR